MRVYAFKWSKGHVYKLEGKVQVINIWVACPVNRGLNAPGKSIDEQADLGRNFLFSVFLMPKGPASFPTLSLYHTILTFNDPEKVA